MSNGFTSSTGSSCCQLASVGRWSRLNNAAPSVLLHYRAFIPNTSHSVPVRHIGTLVLAVLAACDFSLCIGAQVLTFRTKAWLSFAPPPCRMPLGQSEASSKLIPEAGSPPVLTSPNPLSTLLSGSLALASLNLTCRNLLSTFPQRSPPSLLTTAACGGLRSTPDVSRVTPVHTAMRNCTRDEGGPFEVEINTPEHKAFLAAYRKRYNDYPQLGLDRRLPDDEIARRPHRQGRLDRHRKAR